MSLHPQLAADCHVLGELPEGALLVHRSAVVPWMILVPNTEELALYHMEHAEREATLQRWNDLAAFVHSHFSCTRVNMAAIGNLVPQLHLHIVGRRETDPCWPGVVWGQPLPAGGWTTEQLQTLRDDLKSKMDVLSW